MPVTPSAQADWFPLDFQLPSTTTLNPTNSNYVVLFLRHTWNGLALFAILVIVRNTVRKVSARRKRNARTTNTAPATNTKCHRQNPPPFQDTATYLQGQRTLFPPTFSEPYQPQDYHFYHSAPRPAWVMAGHSGSSSEDGYVPHREGAHQASSISGNQSNLGIGPGQAESTTAPGQGGRQRYIMARPPPSRPLTPPAPSRAAVFAPEHGALGASLMHQPNPDYLSHTASASPSPEDSPPEPSRKSHGRTLPLSIPTPPPLQARVSDSSTSSDETQFSPRSFPSPTPFLPPPPPAIDENGKSTDVQGEVISVTDGFGAGWTRHTRVYGGGVCLACAAGGGEGGFYGATALRPEGS